MQKNKEGKEEKMCTKTPFCNSKLEKKINNNTEYMWHKCGNFYSSPSLIFFPSLELQNGVLLHIFSSFLSLFFLHSENYKISFFLKRISCDFLNATSPNLIHKLSIAEPSVE